VPALRVVNGADLPATGWAVRADATAPALQVLARKQDAVEAARAELSGTPGGGVLEVYLKSGRLEYRREITVAGVTDLRVAFGEVGRHRKQADKVVDNLLGEVWPAILALPGGSALAGLIAPAVADERTFFGVFLATLAWSSGIGLAVAFGKTGVFGGTRGWPLVAAIAGCLATGSLVAVWLGHGVYDVRLRFEDYPGPTKVLAFVQAAVETFGPLGAVIGAASGVVAGLWAAKLYRAAAG
jgi:hypothetical protein